MKKILMTLAFLVIFPLGSFAENPYLRLTEPSSGWSSQRVIKIAGETNVKAEAVRLVYNGIPLRLPVNNGRFSRQFVAAPGMNLVYAEIESSDGKKVSDSVSFFSKATPKAMKIVLSWDTNKTDVDLWVIEPTGEKCYYGHKTTKIGGSLDVDITNGYGPEIYTLAAPTKGAYKIQVKYYSDRGNPQTELKVFVVLYEGTPNETIKEFQAMLTKTGEVVTIGVFNLE